MVVIAVVILPGIRRATRQLSKPPQTEEQARRQVMQPAISTPTDAKTKAQLFWISATSQSSLEPATVELSLSADPVLRSEQLLNALITNVPSSERRTLPADATLLAFYIQPDGTAIADFSDALASETPSGVLSEQLAVDSITQTLAANVESIRQLKILIHGQEAETLAGHVDLSILYLVSSPVQAAAPDVPPIATEATGVPSTQSSLPGGKPQATAPTQGTAK